MKHKILTFFLACLVPWLAGAQQSANSQNNVAEKDYIAYLFTYFTGKPFIIILSILSLLPFPLVLYHIFLKL